MRALAPLSAQITFLYCDDLRQSAQFYEQVLGLPLALDQGSCRIYRLPGAAYLGICHAVGRSPQPESIIFTLVTPDVEGWYAHITDAGWQCDHPPRFNETYKILHFFLRDPSGYRIEIQRFAQDPWDQTLSP